MNWYHEPSSLTKAGLGNSANRGKQFAAIILEAIKTNANAENKSLPNAQVHERLENEFLPIATSIAENEGKYIAFSHFVVGIILRALSRPAAAESRFRRANALQPGVLNTLQELVRCLGEQYRDLDALIFAREAISVAPRDAGAWSNLAVALAHCGRHDEARRAISEATKLAPNDLTIRQIGESFDDYFGITVG